jgi:hypothetical protein
MLRTASRSFPSIGRNFVMMSLLQEAVFQVQDVPLHDNPRNPVIVV